MKTSRYPGAALAALSLSMILALPSRVQAYLPNPDLTAAGAIAALKADDLLTDPQSSPRYSNTYNLGSTGLRGWIYIDRNNMGNDGLQTAQSRQILVTVASTPGSAALAVDDVILGAKGGTGTVTAFTSDCRKAFGWAIGDAETAANAGVLSLLRWHAGTTSTVTITLPVMGSYTATAPYSCLKSSLILANARNFLVNQLLGGQLTLSNSLGGAVSGLALLGGVAPGDPNYAAVQTRLQTFAHGLVPQSALSGCDTWNWGYIDTFLSEYYMRTVADGTPDASVLPGINAYTVALARMQSKYGTFGHGGAEQHADGSLHGSISWYGPVNSAGLGANIGIVIGKKALQAGGQAIDAEIDPAITRASNFFGWYVNKGSIPYGEHEPYSNGHASNGKDAMCAVMFGLQDNRPTETEFFTRVTTAGCTGREYGHTGQGFSYLWGAMGANMGGQAAAAAYLNNVRWHLDLERRSDGSFVYDGGEQYGGGTTAGGTYLGSSEIYGGMIPTAWYVLTYALPLQRLYITGRNANSAHILDSTKVAHSIAAATYKLDCTNTVNYPVSRLMTDLGDYDPAIRAYAASELHNRSLTTADENTLITMAEGSIANARMGACETLGLRQTTAALPALGRRLSDSDYWVRGKASNALKNFGSAANPQLSTMLTAFAANATDPNVIVWTDPIQIANGYLASTLFQALATNTNALSGSFRTSLLYPALLAGLKQPDGMARDYLSGFIKDRLSLADVQAVARGIVTAAAERSPADRMYSDSIRYAAITTLAKYKIEEGIPLCLELKEQTWHGDDMTPFDLLAANYRGAAKDALQTLYKWQEHIPQFAADGSINGCCPGRLDNIINHIASTIAAIEGDTAPPTLVNFKSLTASASPPVVTLPATTTVLTPALTDLDRGTPNFVWTKVSGPGTVSFNPSGMAAKTTCTATFNTPGTYVMRATAVDRSILDYNTWITYSLGYYDFQTYDEILGAVATNLTVTVLPDPNRAPVPQNQGLTTPLNTAIAITLAATDPNGDTLTYAVVTPPAHGALGGTAPNLTYTPTTGYTGPDSFTFKANDGKLDSPAGTITIDVGSSGNHRPVAANQYVTTPEDTSKSITLTGIDPDSDLLSYQIVSAPVHGVLLGTVPNLTYLPAANYPGGNSPGTDSFTFTVRDASLTSSLATVNITVTPVNDPPVAQAQSVSVSPNIASPVTLTGYDVEGYALTYAIVSNPSHGTLSGFVPNLNYQPVANYRGADSFTFTVTDSEGAVSPPATISITVINDPPVANAQTVELTPNTATAVTLTGSDSANDPLTFTVVTQPTHGNLTGTAPNLTYTPNTGYTGADSFTFKVNDGASDSPAATVTLNIASSQTWTNIASGTWSTGAKWSGGTAPAAGGSSNNLLVFNTSPYSGSSSNGLTGTFQLNRLNLGSALPALTISGNPLSFATNIVILPQLNQNSANAVTVSNNIALSSNTTVGGTGAGALALSGILSGSGGVAKTSPGILTLSGTNTYSGGTTVTAGTLVLDVMRTNLGTGAVSLAGGTTFYTTNFEGNSSDGAISNTFTLNSGLVTLWTAKDIWLAGLVTGPGGLVITGNGRTPGVMLAGAKTFSGGVKLSPSNGANPTVAIDNINSLGTGTLRSELTSTSIAGNLESRAAVTTAPGVTNPIELATGCRLVVKADGSSHLWLSGPITGGGSLVKIGTATLTVSGSNTYGGATTVSAGTLAISNASSLGQGTLAISSGAKVALNFTDSRPITSLSFAGTAQSNGIYGSSASAAANKNDTYFSGTGTVTVAPATTTALTLTSGVTPATPGASLTFTATVTGSAPTGNVAFYAGATLLGTSGLNPSFQASITTSSLASGSNNITAAYAGNTANGASASAALVIQVLGLPAPPTNLAATVGSNIVGLTWSASDSASGYYVKRSTVSGGPYTTLGTAGVTSYSDTTALNGITYYYVVSATNNVGEGANSAQTSATPAPPTASTTTVASSLGSSGAYGATVTFTATVAVTGGPASGTVTFKDGATVLGAGTLGSGQTTYTINTLAAGSHAITATYGGSLAFQASTSNAFSYTVSKKSVTITGVTASSKTYDGSNIATLSGGSLVGVINGDTVTIIAGTGAFASANVGTWPVAASGYAPGGAYAGNYLLAAQPSVPDATITAVVGVMFSLRNLDVSATAAGAEILNAGTLIEANHFYGTNAPVTLANGLTFGTSWTHTSPAGWSGGQNTNNDDYHIVPLLTDATPFGRLMRNYTWSSVDTDTLTITGLTPGRTYRLQLISVAGKNAGVVVEGSPSTTWTDSPAGTPSVLTATWVQSSGDTDLNVTLTRNHSFGGNHDNELAANGYALHDITPPTSGKDIITFTFPTYGAATITGNNITLTVPNGTPVTAMAPTYTISANATGSPVSGTSRSFTTLQTYTITAQDLTTQTYAVTAILLGQPTNPAATPGNNSVGLTWSAASGASGYKVKRSTTSGGSYATIGTSGTTSYSDPAATNGTTYYYVVSATSGSYESANSSQVSAIPSGLPSSTTLASSVGTQGAYGTAVTFTATVTAGATGTVTFRDGAAVMGTGTLASGQAALTPGTLAMGSHSITATYEGDVTYAYSVSAPFGYAVSAKPVTITGVAAASKVYDGTTAAVLTGGAVSGVVSGETVTAVPGTGAFADANVGTSKTVTASGYALGGTNAGNYTLSAQPGGVLANITARPVVLSGSRIYDGSATAAAAILAISNNLGGANLSLTGRGGLAGKDVGSQLVTGIGTLGLTGAAAGNYTLTGMTGSVMVTPKGLTVAGLAATNKTYDGATTAALTGTAALLTAEAVGSGTTGDGQPYSGDTLTLGGTAACVFANKNAGSLKPVTVTGVTLGGAQAGDYSITQPTGLTANITSHPVTVTAVTASKTYDGTTAAAGTPTIAPPLVGGDTTTVLAQVFQDGNAGAGNKTIIPSISINDGNGGANYSVTLANNNTGTISQATATVTLGNLAATYDGAPKAATATTVPSGRTVTFTYNGSPTAPTNAGSYDVIATVTDTNYAGSANGTLVIGESLVGSWKTSHFTAAEITAGQAADGADPDGDGFTNLDEYTMGTDPHVFNQQPVTLTPAADNHFTLSFFARSASGTGYEGLTRIYTLEATSDPAAPGSWQGVAGYTHIVGDDNTVTIPLTNDSLKKFYRLSVRVE